MSATTVRIPTARLRAAVEAAMEAWQRARHAQVEAALADLMAPPVRTWWERLLSIGPRESRTRAEAIVELKRRPDPIGYSEHERIWIDYGGQFKRLCALKDACDLNLDAVDVAIEDVALFKAHYDPRAEGYR